MATREPNRVLITGAAGQIAYSLIFMVGRGEMFGPEQPVILHLLEIPPAMGALQGVVMEIDDCALPLVAGVVATDKAEEAFKDVDFCIMVGAFPRRPGMERKDLLEKNADIFKAQGAMLDAHASRNVKVLVVGNPANTNCLIMQACAPSIPKENFSALTRLDHNRAKSQIARRLNVGVGSVKNVIIWGNHSSTQYPDVSHGVFERDGASTPILSAVDADWVRGDFITTVQKRGAAIIEARKLSSAASAAKAITDHMRDWVNGTQEGEYVSMAVASDGSYGIAEGVFYSFPVTTSGGNYTIVQGLSVDDFSRTKMDATAKELFEERETAFSFLGIN